jgi:hypothetical protein
MYHDCIHILCGIRIHGFSTEWKVSGIYHCPTPSRRRTFGKLHFGTMPPVKLLLIATQGSYHLAYYVFGHHRPLSDIYRRLEA